MTAILTTSAPVARIARARSVRSAGTDSKSCDERTIRRPPVWLTRSSKPARHSMSTYSAPRARASPRIRRRSSSDPSNRPPSHAGRQVTIDRKTPAGERSRDVWIADAVEPQLDEIGVAHLVSAAAEFRRRGRGDGDAQARFRHGSRGPKGPHYKRAKKKPLQGELKRLEISRVVNVQAKAIASSVERQYHRHAVDEALACGRVNTIVLNRFTRLPTRPRTIAEAARRCQISCPFLLDQ